MRFSLITLRVVILGLKHLGHRVKIKIKKAMSSSCIRSDSDHSFNSLHEIILQKRRSQLVNKRRRKAEEPERGLREFSESSDSDVCSGQNSNVNHVRSKSKWLSNESMFECRRLSVALSPIKESNRTETTKTGTSKDPFAWESLSDVEPIQFTGAPKQSEFTTKPGIFEVYNSPEKVSQKQKKINTKQTVVSVKTADVRNTKGIGKRKFFKNPSRICNWRFDKRTFWTR
ncbi:hypothetical protein LOTGIDRAFT_234337 [Lottia gigantea]|uniref:Uncharacterized protein n=1 Tax=Lottia gigantea TaxID=225164 RepID=V3ZEG5_LOTGI|nr:hypothetical protein LOTGIDRAFT_234337 [Lottia gigantea]ESO89528.1 hypothetical protein LOTGIDRAFT_234337 [Lottia gigantea]